MLRQIPIAEKLNFESQGENNGKFIIEPLYPGYGLTVGNALRRVLLSSMPGAAITAVKIKGIDHEFSAIPYVKEDLIEIILNLKQLRIKTEQDFDEPLKIHFSGKGEREIKAGDFKCPSQISIASPDLVIATMTDVAADVDIECTVEQGRGYIPVETREGDKLEIGNIAIDAYFTPVVKVSFKKENVRVGQMTNWDKLILELETDGTIDCQEALSYAANILKEQFSFIASPSINTQENIAEENEEKDEYPQKLKEDEEDVAEDEETEEAPKKRGRPKKQTE